ncbi:MAG TPA: hypothetical protein PLZ45_16050 [Ferruginibacter sp.]|nr:hypothetical protein [Ferruginibacter sp.]
MARKIVCILIVLLSYGQLLVAQSLTGIWSGKISRKSPDRAGVESIEIQIYQSGRNLSGYSFTFKDTSRFVLYDMYGKRDKKKQMISIREAGYAYFILPPGFLPCEKAFELKYYKIGKTQYLSGRWSGRGNDTTCFPGEELLVVLQKIRRPEYPIEHFVQKKMTDYFLRKIPEQDTLSLQEPEKPVTAETVPGIPASPDSLPRDRKLEIQQILKVTDSIVHVSLYDNAIIDDDTVSVFVDKKPVLLKERISAQPLTFQLAITEPGRPMEIIMQAENLGSIPPNTAIMIVQAGDKRYEVRLSSSLEKHAVVILTYDPED